MKSKEILKNIIMPIISFIFVFVILSFLVHPASLKNTYMDAMNRLYSNWEIENSEIVYNISYLCDYGYNEVTVNCVVLLLGKHYNYSGINRTHGNIKKVDNFNDGWICRDIAVGYDAIFRNLGFESQFVFFKEHVYNVVYKKIDNRTISCRIDGALYNCW